MLKIKDNVDLRVLELYGFNKDLSRAKRYLGKNFFTKDEIKENKYFYLLSSPNYDEDFILIDNNNFIKLCSHDEWYDFEYDIPNVIFDLINDDLVEKVKTNGI